MASKYYLTTSIAYVNAAPHVGHALEFIQADCIARAKRNSGHDVFFLTGTDEHGTKLYQTAKAAGADPREFATVNSDKFRALTEMFSLSNDHFIRTTDDSHKRGAKKFWEACREDIYKDTYEGLYCVGCEAYKNPDELEDGICPLHPNLKPENIKEENYFFKLSKYADEIKKLIEADKLKIVPASRKNEILEVIRGGLRDVSVSRPKEKLPWGVEVPGDPDHVMYVWFDALPNYITGVGYGDADRADEFKKWWPADLHIIGKDILRFHAALWPGMLLSAKLPLPKTILVHGFVTGEGQKMSKSLGNVLDPVEIAGKYGSEALRYYLLREIPATEDGDFSMKRFVERYNFDLANDLGNLVQRISAMTEKYLGGKLPALEIKPTDKEGFKKSIIGASDEVKKMESLMDDYRIGEALDFVWEKVRALNAYIESTKPWEAAKQDEAAIQKLVREYIERLLDAAWFLEPFLPKTSLSIMQIFSGDKLHPVPPLFPKIAE